MGHEPDGLQRYRGDPVASHTKRVVGRPGVGLARVGQFTVEENLIDLIDWLMVDE